MNGGILVDEPKDDSVGAAARREVAGQFAPERLAHTTRILTKGAAAELPDSKGNGER
jgi:hypothetical protein